MITDLIEEMIMTELQNIGLVYEAMYVESTDVPFTKDFNTLPDTCPYGFWVNSSGEFLYMVEPIHGDFVDMKLSEMPNGEEIRDKFSDDIYGIAFTLFKWVRVVRGPGTKLYYASSNVDLISRQAMLTIQDLAMLYDRHPSWAPDPRWHPPGASDAEYGVPFLD